MKLSKFIRRFVGFLYLFTIITLLFGGVGVLIPNQGDTATEAFLEGISMGLIFSGVVGIGILFVWVSIEVMHWAFDSRR